MSGLDKIIYDLIVRIESERTAKIALIHAYRAYHVYRSHMLVRKIVQFDARADRNFLEDRLLWLIELDRRN